MKVTPLNQQTGRWVLTDVCRERYFMDGRVQVDDVGGRFDRVKVSRQPLQDTQKTCQLQSSAGTARMGFGEKWNVSVRITSFQSHINEYHTVLHIS